MPKTYRSHPEHWYQRTRDLYLAGDIERSDVLEFFEQLNLEGDYGLSVLILSIVTEPR